MGTVRISSSGSPKSLCSPRRFLMLTMAMRTFGASKPDFVI